MVYTEGKVLIPDTLSIKYPECESYGSLCWYHPAATDILPRFGIMAPRLPRPDEHDSSTISILPEWA